LSGAEGLGRGFTTGLIARAGPLAATNFALGCTERLERRGIAADLILLTICSATIVLGLVCLLRWSWPQSECAENAASQSRTEKLKRPAPRHGARDDAS
jgi:hypothetical protein